MDLGKSPSKSPPKPKSSSKSNKNDSNLMEVGKEDGKLKSYYVISSKAPSHTQDAYIAPIDPRLNTLQNQAGRFNANIEDVCNRNYRNEANTMPAQDLHKIQPPIPSDHFFAKRDYFTGFTIFQSLSKHLIDLIHAARIDMNHTFAANTSAMYGFTLNYSNINEYFEGTIAVMPTLKYANQSFSDYGYVVPEPSYLVPESRWGICPLPVGSEAKIRKIEGSVYGLKDFLPLFPKTEINSVKRVLTTKIEHCRKLQMDHITEQLEKLKENKIPRTKDKEKYIKETEYIIAQWKKDANEYSVSRVADEIMKDENVGKLRQVMCRLTLNRIHPLLDKQDKINSRNFAALATAVENIDNTTTSNTKITKSYIDLKDGKEKTKDEEIKAVEINITAPSLGPNTEALTSAALVYDDLRLIGSDSILAEAILSAHGERPSKHKHHLTPWHHNIVHKPHKPVEIEIDYKDIKDKSELFAAVEDIKRRNKIGLFPTSERLRKDFFPKLATELQKGFVYKELDNGDKLKVVKISNDEAMILAEDEAAAIPLSALDPTHGYVNWSDLHQAERRSSSSMDQGSSPPDANYAASSVPMDQGSSPSDDEAVLMSNSKYPTGRRHIVLNKPYPKLYNQSARAKMMSDDYYLNRMMSKKPSREKKRAQLRAERHAKKRTENRTSGSLPNKGGKCKTRKNRR